jgi:hypothetical protein
MTILLASHILTGRCSDDFRPPKEAAAAIRAVYEQVILWRIRPIRRGYRAERSSFFCSMYSRLYFD